jgi:hypothetical protein
MTTPLEPVEMPATELTLAVPSVARRYFVNESGLKIDANTGDLFRPVYPDAQCSPP